MFPVPNRSQQRQAVENAKQAAYAAQDASDLAAAQAGATRMELDAATRIYNQTSDPGKKEALAGPLLQLQSKDQNDTQSAQTAFEAWSNLFGPFQQAVSDTQINPGVQEQV